jgi:hypothetical protein
MTCTRECRPQTDEATLDCKRGCSAATRRLAAMLEPDVAMRNLMVAQLEMLNALGGKKL